MPNPQAQIEQGDQTTFHLVMQGDWRMDTSRPVFKNIVHSISLQSGNTLVVDGSGIQRWDSTLLTFLQQAQAYCNAAQCTLRCEHMPDGVDALLDLSSRVPPADTSRRRGSRSILQRIGYAAILFTASVRDMLSFLGEMVLATLRFFTGRALIRTSDIFSFIQSTGPEALPIVILISLLVGVILAFVGAVQLRLFGAEIYVANLVGLGMTREMGAMMAAIIMAGRTGAAFAAQLGTMQVNEEIDALRTSGIEPIDFLVLPRMIALTLMMPLLTIFADILGIIGGLLIGVGMLDLTFAQYILQTKMSVTPMDIYTGLIKSYVFGILIATSGCMRGMQCGRSATAVGQATTSAVVTSIVAIVVADAILTVIYDILGI